MRPWMIELMIRLGLVDPSVTATILAVLTGV